ncbi:S8 family serine peptidase [Candidatus Micrarchaeota archaeon]|nr:S8 family serine peptidase [Candidatus Micrarchaeota archaeon]
MNKGFFVAILLLLINASILVDAKRVISQSIDDSQISKLQKDGCKITHSAKELLTAVSFDCPENAKLSVAVEDDEQVSISDIRANDLVGASIVHSSFNAGAGRVIAILDTGVDYNHSELNTSIFGGKCYMAGCGSYFDDNGHGSHVAGIITADGVNPLAKGIAPDAKIFAGKVLDANGNGYFSDVIAGINDVANMDGIDAISMSLSTSNVYRKNCDLSYSSLKSAIDYANSKGKVVIVAAGNNAGGVGAPGCISTTIAVGAVDFNDNIASFSGRGNPMKDHGIVAPGVGIYSIYRGGYAYLSGTSMATPAVSGTVALMRAKNPSITVAQIKAILFSTAKDLGQRNADTIYGKGRLDALKAVQAS